MPNKPKTKMRGVRIPPRLWGPLERITDERGESRTAFILRAIEHELIREGVRLDED